jgi:hypothetical protein
VNGRPDVVGEGADVRVTLYGRERTAHVALEQDPVRATQVFKELLERAGARAVGVKVNVKHAPTLDEIKPVLAHRVIAHLTLGVRTSGSLDKSSPTRLRPRGPYSAKRR